MIKATVNNNVKKVQQIIEQEKLDVNDIYEMRGIQVKIFDYQKALINTRMWNPLHYALYFGQVSVIEYLINDMKMNAKICSNQPYTMNEFANDDILSYYLENTDSLYAFYIVILSRNRDTLTHIYEKLFPHFQTDEFELRDLLKICLKC